MSHFISFIFIDPFLPQKIESTLHALIEMKTHLEGADATVASGTKSRLKLMHGFSIHGFFNLDRTIFPALLGHILTYVIILIEFRMSQNS